MIGLIVDHTRIAVTVVVIVVACFAMATLSPPGFTIYGEDEHVPNGHPANCPACAVPYVP